MIIGTKLGNKYRKMAILNCTKTIKGFCGIFVILSGSPSVPHSDVQNLMVDLQLSLVVWVVYYKTAGSFPNNFCQNFHF